MNSCDAGIGIFDQLTISNEVESWFRDVVRLERPIIMIPEFPYAEFEEPESRYVSMKIAG